MRRCFHHLTKFKRYDIEQFLSRGLSSTAISREVGVHRSTISREIKRNSGRHGYFAKGAQAFAEGRKPSTWDCSDRKKIRDELELAIREKLISLWSPQQISARLEAEWGVKISHQSIYNYVYQCSRFGDPLHRCLRRFGRRKRRYGIRRRRGVMPSPGQKKRISERTEEANQRTELGHWERDLVEGKRGHSCLLTIVDRKSRFTLIRKIEKRSSEFADKSTKAVFQSGKLSCRSMTNDNGHEFHSFKKLEKKLHAPIYFTEPYQAWQRGTNENTNGLIRQLFPKRTDFSEISAKEIRHCENLLNSRPKRVLKFHTPEEIHFSRQRKLFRTKIFYRNIIIQQKREELLELTRAFGG